MSKLTEAYTCLGADQISELEDILLEQIFDNDYYYLDRYNNFGTSNKIKVTLTVEFINEQH